MKHRDAYYAAFKLEGAAESLSSAEDDPSDADRTILMKQKGEDESLEAKKAATETDIRPIIPLPGLFSQARHLVKRRWTLLRRSPKEWIGHTVMLVVAPVIAALLFAIGLVVRFFVGTSVHDPWLWVFAGLLCLALAGVVSVPWPRRA